MATKWLIDDWVEEAAANSKIRYFFPSAVSRALEVPVEEAFSRLLDLAEDGKLVLMYDVRCPTCFYSICIVLPEEKPNSVTCPLGDYDGQVTPEMVYPVFRITDGYRAQVQAKKTAEGRACCSHTAAVLFGPHTELGELGPPTVRGWQGLERCHH